MYGNRALAVVGPITLALLLSSSLLWAQEYDLLLKGGHVVDPAHQIDRPMDVAVRGDEVARVAPEIAASQARRVLDVGGLYVVPGLIDLHAHHYGYSGAIFPDDTALPAGTTTTVDCGGPGWRNFEDFKQKIVERSTTRVLAFINIVGHGMLGSDYENNADDMDPVATANKIKQYPGLIVGIKNAHFSRPGFVSVQRAIEAGRLSGTPVILDNNILSWTERDTETKVLKLMRPGDLHTHTYNDRHLELLNRQTGEVQPYMREARRRGVLFDLGHGGGSFLWPVAVKAMQNGFPPDTISTDLHASSIMGSESDMPNCISKLMNLGMALPDAIERSTVRPAQVIRRFPELGTLGEGKVADIAVLSLKKGVFTFNDAWGKKLTGTQKLINMLTIRAGEIVYDRNGLAFPEWEPAGNYAKGRAPAPQPRSQLTRASSDEPAVWDILFKNGHVIDPYNGRNERLDIAVTGERIARVGRNLAPARARLVVELDGYYVTPGLIDLNVHVDAPGAWLNLNADHNALRFGVTTVVDSGSTGWRNFEDFKEKVVDDSRVRVLAFLNIAASGLRDESPRLTDLDPPATARTAGKYSDIIVGIRSAYSESLGPEALDRALEAARQADLPLMAHFSSAEEAPADEIRLEKLRPGDLITYLYGLETPLLTEDGRVQARIAEARRRGVLFDLGHGSRGFWFRIAAPAIEQRFLPDTISTAMDKTSILLPRTEMMTTLSKLLNLGIPLEELVRRSTVVPAKVIGRTELGTLSEGAVADIAVIRLQEGRLGFLDSAHTRLSATRNLKAVLTVRNGRIVWDTEGLSRAEWENSGPYSNYR